MTTRRTTTQPSSSREQILELLLWEPLTVEELAIQTQLTPNGVRAQLTALERDGLVARGGLRHAGAVGKPPVVYALTKQAESDLSVAYPAALTAIIETLRAGLEPKVLKSVLTQAGKRLAGSPQGKSPTAVLEALGARVKVDRRTDGSERVEGASCPLASAVREEPVTCELVRSLLASSLDRKVEMKCHHGDRPRCCFEVGAPKAR